MTDDCFLRLWDCSAKVRQCRATRRGRPFLLDLDIASLLDRSSDTRKVRAYAYLTASFRVTPNTSGIIDCLLPFLAAGVARQAGHLLELDRLSAYLGELGLRVPWYVLQQLVPRLEEQGIVEWNKAAHRHICNQAPPSGAKAADNSSNLEEAFKAFEQEFRSYAQAHGVEKPPASQSWSDALIAFLKSDAPSDGPRATTVRETIIGDSGSVETYLVARFIQEAQTARSHVFDTIVQIFTGVLIEDFINNIQSVGDATKYSSLTTYYDTTVLLRLLGTSGSLLLTATLEMHRSLQDLGCKSAYLEYAGDEVSNILDGIVAAYDAGGEIYNETSEALISGEISIAQIRDLRATFEQRLGERNIFPFQYNYGSRKQEDTYQIDEEGVVAGLVAEAAKRDRSYKRSSAVNDARSVAIIMRLRRGVARRSLSSSGHIFISRNPLLQVVARRWVAKEVDGYDGPAIPPVLTLGQISTVAWLSTAKTLEPIQISKELLATCYNAVRPSLAWTQEFARALDTFREQNPGFIESRANAILFLQTARTAARDESLNQPAVLRKANIAALFAEASAHTDALEASRRSEIEQLHGEYRRRLEEREAATAAHQAQMARDAQEALERLARQAEHEKLDAERRSEEDRKASVEIAARRAAAEATVAQLQIASEHRKGMADRIAHILTIVLRILVSAAIGVLFYLSEVSYWKPGWATTLLPWLFAGLFVLANIDLSGLLIVAIPVRRFEAWVSGLLFRGLTRLEPAPSTVHDRTEPTLGRMPRDRG